MTWLFHIDTVENYAYAEQVFTPEECDTIKKFALAQEKHAAKIVGDANKGDIEPLTRKNSIVWLHDSHPELTWLFEKLAGTAVQLNEKFFKFDLWGFCEPLQFTEYSNPGDFYDQHHDKLYYSLSRKLSVVVQLTDPDQYEGCELKLNTGGEFQTAPKTLGSVIIFPSYLLHKITPLMSGTRHSLVAWIAGPNFK